MTEFTDVVVWASGLTAILAFATTLWNLLTSGSRANSRIISAHTKGLDALARRIDHFESELANTPSRDTLHGLELSMSRLEGDLKTLNERLRPVASIVDRMQELMIKESHNK